jgi:hypothetical protein
MTQCSGLSESGLTDGNTSKIRLPIICSVRTSHWLAFGCLTVLMAVGH